MANPLYLVRHDNGRIFNYTPDLANRVDMIQAMDMDEARSLAKKRGNKLPDKPSLKKDDDGNVQGLSEKSDESDQPFVISTATKDELEAFAQEQYNVDLDKRKSVASLREEVAALAE